MPTKYGWARSKILACDTRRSSSLVIGNSDYSMVTPPVFLPRVAAPAGGVGLIDRRKQFSTCPTAPDASRAEACFSQKLRRDFRDRPVLSIDFVVKLLHD